MKTESQREAARRLSKQLKIPVTRDMVRSWGKRGFDLGDSTHLTQQLLNSERPPKGLQRPAAAEQDRPGPMAPAEFDDRLKELEAALLTATNYETARTIKTQIAGVKELHRTQVERGHYVTKESQEREGLQIGQTIKQLIMKIPAELPQALVGLEYPAAVKKCEDFAHHILTEIHEFNPRKTPENPDETEEN